MFRVIDAYTGAFVLDTHDAGDALRTAIQRANTDGFDHRITDDYGNEVWFVEADTKVDDADPHFPAIVHFRDPGPSTGAQCLPGR